MTKVSVVVVTRNRKQELIRCLKSLSISTYKNIEIIVVDNGSGLPVISWAKKLFPKVSFIRNEENIGAAAGRNLGMKDVLGEYLLFIDDDAEADSEMIKELVLTLEKEKKIGIVHPKIYDMDKRNVLQGLGCDINLLTARVSAVGIREVDNGQYNQIREIQTVGCIWMVKKEVIEKIGDYDEEYFIPYEDTDFSIRAKKAGFKILFVPKALAWHEGKKSTYVNPLIDYLGIRSVDRAYRISRNKIIFMRKNAPAVNFLIFFFFLNPVYLLVHSFIIIMSGRFDILTKYYLGFVSGIWYVIKYNNPVIKVYQYLDKRMLNFKYKMMVLTDPICIVIDKSAKTVLDVGSGLGVPMQLIKEKIKVKYSVGVDLFQPYIDSLKLKNIHDKYVLADVRRMKFKAKSFDVVFASDVLEHMSKKDSWALLKNMEYIAKKQVIITTSLGYFYHPPVDNNPLQLHVSGYDVEEFKKRGYKTFKYGRKELLGTGGLVHVVKFDPLKKAIFLLNFILFPFYFIFPNLGNYCFVAFKDMKLKV